jgi:hypothetical protein
MVASAAAVIAGVVATAAIGLVGREDLTWRDSAG